MWDLPGPGIEPVSAALVGGFLTTAPPGKSQAQYLKSNESLFLVHGNSEADQAVLLHLTATPSGIRGHPRLHGRARARGRTVFRRDTSFLFVAQWPK